MTKRILGMTLAAVLVLGLAGVALASSSDSRPSFALEEADLVAADPGDPAADPARPNAARREELRACVKTKVDGGSDRKAAAKECADQLGIRPGRVAKPGRPGPKALRGAAHAELVVPKRGAEGQWETVVVDRGQVEAASADSITLKRPDGPTVTLKVVPGTKVRGAATVADLAPGRAVVVTSAGGEARTVVARG